MVALMQIDMGNVGNWAEAHRLPFTTFKDLSRKPEVVRPDRRGGGPGEPGPARRAPASGDFALFDKELDADDDELTRTQKVRRATILTKYRDMIEELYAGRRPAREPARGERVAAGGRR